MTKEWNFIDDIKPTNNPTGVNEILFWKELEEPTECKKELRTRRYKLKND